MWALHFPDGTSCSCVPLADKCGATCRNFHIHRPLYIALIHCFYEMATPAMNFVAVCANASLPLPSSKTRQQNFLKDSGVIMPASSSISEIKEQAASLVWVRHAVANNIPPDTWPSLLAPALLTDVCGLYPIPPAKSCANPVETDPHWRARVVTLFMPDVLSVGPAPPSHPTASTTHGAHPSQGGGINTQRPPPGAQGAPPAALAPQSSGAPALPPP